MWFSYKIQEQKFEPHFILVYFGLLNYNYTYMKIYFKKTGYSMDICV